MNYTPPPTQAPYSDLASGRGGSTLWPGSYCSAWVWSGPSEKLLFSTSSSLFPPGVHPAVGEGSRRFTFFHLRPERPSCGRIRVRRYYKQTPSQVQSGPGRVCSVAPRCRGVAFDHGGNGEGVQREGGAVIEVNKFRPTASTFTDTRPGPGCGTSSRFSTWGRGITRLEPLSGIVSSGSKPRAVILWPLSMRGRECGSERPDAGAERPPS
jgi:hypothetical protein